MGVNILREVSGPVQGRSFESRALLKGSVQPLATLVKTLNTHYTMFFV